MHIILMKITRCPSLYLSAEQVVPPAADVSDGVEGDVVEEGEDEQPHLRRQTAHVLVPLEFSFDHFSAGFLKY